jgi:hypothetical protein
MRPPIPEEIAAKVLFHHDRTCCVCRERGKRVQIHHIDENPSNNDPRNLAALCFDCHDQTQIKGGFGRGLNPAQITTYRDDWEKRVAENRERADQLLLDKQIGVINTATAKRTTWTPPSKLELTAYVESIPDTMKKAYEVAQPEWDKGATNVVAQATYQVTAVAERLWIGLSAWYPPKHFEGKEPTEFVGEFLRQRYDLRHSLMEPEGIGTGGSMMRPMVAYGVLLDLQELIVLSVRMLLTFVQPDTGISLDDWVNRFRTATNSYPC